MFCTLVSVNNRLMLTIPEPPGAYRNLKMSRSNIAPNAQSRIFSFV
jgi:hypothetical protein